MNNLRFFKEIFHDMFCLYFDIFTTCFVLFRHFQEIKTKHVVKNLFEKTQIMKRSVKKNENIMNRLYIIKFKELMNRQYIIKNVFFHVKSVTIVDFFKADIVDWIPIVIGLFQIWRFSTLFENNIRIVVICSRLAPA